MAKRVKKKIKQRQNHEENTANEQSQAQHTAPEDGTIYDSPEVLQDQISRSQELIEQNKNLVIGLAVGLVVVLVAAFGYTQYSQAQEQEAQAEIAPAIFYFEKDSLGKALNGDNNSTIGLLGVADEYSGSDAANIANFYIGSSYLKQGKFDEAIEYLEDFGGGDILVQARAYSLLGDAYMEKEDFDKAVSYYTKASNYEPNDQFTPVYLMKLGLAHEMAGNKESAQKAYNEIVADYPQSREVNNAKKALAAL